MATVSETDTIGPPGAAHGRVGDDERTTAKTEETGRTSAVAAEFTAPDGTFSLAAPHPLAMTRSGDVEGDDGRRRFEGGPDVPPLRSVEATGPA